MFINAKNVSISYTQKEKCIRVLEDVSLKVEKGEIICLLGPSGCGKTTLLNALAGFQRIDSGSITIDGKDVVKPSNSYVTIFQNYGLLPWRTVQKNVELGLEPRGIPKKQREEVGRKYLKMVGLSSVGGCHPYQLSGGMKQRVAIARALAVDPEILFMDEPFGALDAITRMKLQEDILQLSKGENKTILFVTHDIEEAVFLADRIVVMSPNPGKVQSIIKVQMRHVRDRTSDEFLLYRDRIYEIFHMKKDIGVEYYL